MARAGDLDILGALGLGRLAAHLPGADAVGAAEDRRRRRRRRLGQMAREMLFIVLGTPTLIAVLLGLVVLARVLSR